MPPARRATILVVEDDPVLRTYYRSALMLSGFRVEVAGDGIEALMKVEGYRPAAVVLDLGLPRMSGRDVARELFSGAAFADIPVVIVTGSDTLDIDEPKLACVLRKPVTPEALITAVEACLRRA